jgi:hypothetical protein
MISVNIAVNIWLEKENRDRCKIELKQDKIALLKSVRFSLLYYLIWFDF